MTEIELAVITADVTWVQADLLALKHAGGFYGADAAVAQAISEGNEEAMQDFANTTQEKGYFCIDTHEKIRSCRVLFLRTNSLRNFRYEQARSFSENAIRIASKIVDDASHIAMTIHGPGVGLDPSIAFLAQIGGILQALATRTYPNSLEGVSFVERDPERSRLLALLLEQRFFGEPYSRPSPTGTTHRLVVDQLVEFYSAQR